MTGSADYRLIMRGISIVCLLGAVSAIVPAVEYAVTVGLVAIVLLGHFVAGLWLLVRWLRERREDREDEITASAWRAARARTAVP